MLLRFGLHFVNALRQRLDAPWPIDQSYNFDGYGASRLVMACFELILQLH